MTEFSIDDISKTVKDSLYVTIGLGVIAFQKAQVQRQELQKQVESNLSATRSVVGDSLKTIQERLEAVTARPPGTAHRHVRTLKMKWRDAPRRRPRV